MGSVGRVRGGGEIKTAATDMREQLDTGVTMNEMEGPCGRLRVGEELLGIQSAGK